MHGWKHHAYLNELWTSTETLKISLMAHFSATWSASDRPVSPYNSGSARIEAPQAPEDLILITAFGFKML